jgi:hypothetical protein
MSSVVAPTKLQLLLELVVEENVSVVVVPLNFEDRLFVPLPVVVSSVHKRHVGA